MLRNFSLIVVVLIAASTAQADPIDVSLTTDPSGTVPGTAITYTVTNTGNTARDIFPGGTTANGVFNITSGFNEFASLSGTDSFTRISFSAPVPVSEIVFGFDSISPTAGSLYTANVAGGTGVAADFNLIDGLPAANGNTGTAAFMQAGPSTHANPSAADQGIIFGSTSTDTITLLIISGADPGDGFGEFFGFVNPATSAAVPEPSSIALCGIAGVVGLVIARVRARRKTAATA